MPHQMLRRFTIFSTSVLALLTVSGLGLCFAEPYGFVERGYYTRQVEIPNPENSPLAEALLQAGIDVKKSCGYLDKCFRFKIEETPVFTVFIYYPDEQRYVGKFVFTPTAESSGNPTAVQSEFVRAFVPWFIQNAWPSR